MDQTEPEPAVDDPCRESQAEMQRQVRDLTARLEVVERFLATNFA